MGSFVLYFLSLIKLIFKLMFFAFRVLLYNFNHAVDAV